jgi:hypothetical protein
MTVLQVFRVVRPSWRWGDLAKRTQMGRYLVERRKRFPACGPRQDGLGWRWCLGGRLRLPLVLWEAEVDLFDPGFAGVKESAESSVAASQRFKEGKGRHEPRRWKTVMEHGRRFGRRLGGQRGRRRRRRQDLGKEAGSTFDCQPISSPKDKWDRRVHTLPVLVRSHGDLFTEILLSLGTRGRVSLPCPLQKDLEPLALETFTGRRR